MEERLNKIITYFNGNGQDLHKNQFISENQDHNSQAINSKLFSSRKKSQNDTKIVKRRNNGDLKTKITEDGVAIEKDLSDGEALGFETVSTIDYKGGVGGLDCSFCDENSYNIIVEVKNELASQYKIRSYRKIPSNEIKTEYSDWHKQYYFLNEYHNQRCNGFGGTGELRYQQQKKVDKNHDYYRRNRETNERKNVDHSRQHTYSNDWSTCRDQFKIFKRSRWDDRVCRSRRSRSNERLSRNRSSRSPERSTRIRSPSCKDTKAESRHSRSYDRNSTSSSSERDSPCRKRSRNSWTKGSTSSIWKRLGSRKSPDRIKKDEVSSNYQKNLRSSVDTASRKKERTPFMVELERKLKETDRLKNLKLDSSESEDRTNGSVNKLAFIPALPLAINENLKPSMPSIYTPPLPNVQMTFYTEPFTAMPTVSVDNLPLMPGPSGLPVHITELGDQIPHDMDGRPIPVGPNGFYLPLDPTGRVFAHIVSPRNQAVPIHMTEDGVLRLPNSEPVPFGPEHQFPVNIDGRVIPIGPDSRPLYPCHNLPKEPPLNVQKSMVFNEGEHIAQKALYLPTPNKGDQKSAQTETKQTQTENQIHCQPPGSDICELDVIQNPFEEIKAETDLLEISTYKSQKKSEDAPRCIKIDKSLDQTPSKEESWSAFNKLMQKKIYEDDFGSSSSLILLDSEDSDSVSTFKSALKPKKDPIEEIVINSDDEHDIEITCDKEVPKTPSVQIKTKNFMMKKIQRAIKLLYKKNYTPPVLGRFIVSNRNIVPVVNNSPNESPLLRNRIKLSFITPNSSFSVEPIIKKKSDDFDKFLPQKKFSIKEEKEERSGDKHNNSNSKTLSVFTIDFAMQCDFTSEIIRNLSCKVCRLEMEVAQLKHINTNLFDNYREVQNVKQIEAEKLRSALLEIQEKNNEIRLLKCLTQAPK